MCIRDSARFVDSRLTLDADAATSRQSVYQDYNLWANMNRIFPVLSEPKFARELIAAHPEAEVRGNDEVFMGLRLSAAYNPGGTPYDPLAAVLRV